MHKIWPAVFAAGVWLWLSPAQATEVQPVQGAIDDSASATITNSVNTSVLPAVVSGRRMFVFLVAPSTNTDTIACRWGGTPSTTDNPSLKLTAGTSFTFNTTMVPALQALECVAGSGSQSLLVWTSK